MTNNDIIPKGATHYEVCTIHFSEDYSHTNFYRLTRKTYTNSVIDHPEERIQFVNIWDYFENNKWVSIGNGWDPRRIKPIEDFNPTA